LLDLVSSFTTTSGAQHALVDVWFARAPALSELLHAPATDVLAGEGAGPTQAAAPAMSLAAAEPDASGPHAGIRRNGSGHR